MNITQISDWINFDADLQQNLTAFALQLSIFLLFVIISLILGRATPVLVSLIVRKFAPKNFASIYENLLVPLGCFSEVSTA